LRPSGPPAQLDADGPPASVREPVDAGWRILRNRPLRRRKVEAGALVGVGRRRGELDLERREGLGTHLDVRQPRRLVSGHQPMAVALEDGQSLEEAGDHHPVPRRKRPHGRRVEGRQDDADQRVDVAGQEGDTDDGR
jgi:hypothetical protein